MDPSKIFIPYIPEGFSIKIPTGLETLTESTDSVDSFYIFSHYFESWWSLPLPPIIDDFLRFTNLALGQLLPNAYKALLAGINMFKSKRVNMDAKSLVPSLF